MLTTTHNQIQNQPIRQPNEFNTKNKIRLALNLNALTESSTIAHYPAIYIGSGLDLEFPLVLNARHIVMIDPCFAVEKNRQTILKKVLEYGSEAKPIRMITAWHHHIEFNFDSGRGPEKTTVDLFARSFADYRSILPIGYIIEFNSILNHSLFKANLLERLLIGGLVINNHESPLRQTMPKLSILDWVDFSGKSDSEEELEDKQARKLGLETIRVDNVPFAVYQKVADSPRLIKYANSCQQ